MQFVVIVQSVTAQHPQKRALLHPTVGDIREIHTGGVALIFDVETETGLLNTRGEIVHVFHHQVPVALRGVVGGVLQRFHEECLRGLCIVAGKLSHLI